MAKFVMLGRYTQSSMGEISASRTAKAEEVIRAHGGEAIGIYALLGAFDLVFIVEVWNPIPVRRVSSSETRIAVSTSGSSTMNTRSNAPSSA